MRSIIGTVLLAILIILSPKKCIKTLSIYCRGPPTVSPTDINYLYDIVVHMRPLHGRY